MPCANPCKNCDRKGLPILFTRYAATYSAQDVGTRALKQLCPSGALQRNPEGVALKIALYNVRMLRPGYLYVRTKRMGLNREWIGYVVHPHGYLAEFAVECPQDAKPNPACEVEVRGAIASMVWVADAKRVETLHYMFHPDPIEYDHLTSEIEPSLGKYMQSFDVAGWANGNTSQKDTSQPGQVNSQVVEFAALSNAKIRDAMDGQFFGLMGTNPQERGWGDYDETVEEEIPNPGAMGDNASATIRIEKVIDRKGMPYVGAHGSRLRKMAELLQKNSGAVVACEDPIGIAQALSMCHATAAAPYELWLQSAPDAPVPNFPNMTNGWLAAAAGSIDQLLGAMRAGLTSAQTSSLETLKSARASIGARTSTSPGYYELGPDGTRRLVTPDETKARRLKDVDKRIATKQSEINQGINYDSKSILADARMMFYQGKIDDFQDLHRPKLDALDARLDAISADTVAWLDAKPMLTAAARYNGRPVAEVRSDGERFALQLSVALMNLDTSETGKNFLLRKNPFSFARDNLVARVIGCNDAEVSAELQAACDRLQASAVDNGFSGEQRDPDEARLKQIEGLAKELGGWKKVIKSSDKMNKLYGKTPDKSLDRLKSINDVNDAIKAAAGAGWTTVVFAAVTLFAVKGKASSPEGMFLAARGLALAHGLGSQATELLKKDAERLADKLRKNSSYGNVGLGRANDWLAKEREMQATLESHVAAASKGQGVLGKLRVSGLVAVAEGLGVLVGAGGKTAVKKDLRSAFDASGQLLSATGSFKDIRAMLCEEMVYKTVVPSENQVAAFARGTQLETVAGREVLRLKSAAGRYTIAGSTIAVALDVFDTARAIKSKDQAWLATSHIVRTVGGLVSIGGIAVGMRSLAAVRLITSLNLAGLVITVVSTVAIEMLKDKEWQSWFKSQPFRIEKFANDSWFDISLKPTPFKSRVQMMSRLDDAIKETKRN